MHILRQVRNLRLHCNKKMDPPIPLAKNNAAYKIINDGMEFLHNVLIPKSTIDDL